MSSGGLKPFVLWGQNKQLLFLRVNISDLQTAAEVNFKVKSLNFKCRGTGITGVNDYAFSIDLLHPIDSKKSSFKVTQRAIEIVMVKKMEAVKWERVQEIAGKNHWLKIDFDRFAFDTSDESEEEKVASDNLTNLYQPPMHLYDKEQLKGNHSLATLKISYLLIFNLFQFIGYSLILATTLFHLYKRRYDESFGLESAFSLLGPKVMACQLLAVLEIFHAALGWVRSSPLPAVLQVVGRGIILFVIILPEEKLHNKDIIFYLFGTWSAVEVVRYPYYMLSVVGKEVGVVTWLRYTIWVPLYPLGFLFEGLVMILSLPLLEASGRYNFLLPNQLNLHFHFLTCFTAYMFCFLPGMYVLMNRMYLQRKKKLHDGGKKGGVKRKKGQ